MCGHHVRQSMDQSGVVANAASGQLNRKNDFPCPRSRLRIWSRETVRAPRPASVRSLSTPRLDILLTYASSLPSHSAGRRPSIPSTAIQYRASPKCYWVTHLRTDGIYRRESARTRSVVLKAGQVTGAAYSAILTNIYAPLFLPTPTNGTVVDMREIDTAERDSW